VSAAWLIFRKDLRVLRRSPLLLAVLVAYPLVIALLVGLVAGYSSSKPRVALVDLEHLPPRITLGGKTFDVQRTIDEVSRNVRLVRLPQREAERELSNGKVVAVLTVPRGFVSDLTGMVRSPTLKVELAPGALRPRLEQQVQALVYTLNRTLQEAYIGTNLNYVQLILHGGTGSFLGRRFDVLGLDGAQRLLRELPNGPRISQLREFVGDARLALAQTGNALRATANPIALQRVNDKGRTWLLGAQVQAYALAVTLSFLALVLAAGALASERDENVIGRLARGLVRKTQLVAAKVALAAVVGGALGFAVALLFGAIVEIGGVEGGEPWSRLPLVAVGVLLAGAAVGAVGAVVGALARESRAASLVAVLVVLPVVFLGLVPREIVPAAGWVSDALPFAHAVRFFSGALYDVSPWDAVLREAAWLVGLTLAFGAAARVAMRRLVA
jgi:ABC-type transport system involved in cytochrome c biogenesis permease component